MTPEEIARQRAEQLMQEMTAVVQAVIATENSWDEFHLSHSWGRLSADMRAKMIAHEQACIEELYKFINN